MITTNWSEFLSNLKDNKAMVKCAVRVPDRFRRRLEPHTPGTSSEPSLVCSSDTEVNRQVQAAASVENSV